jgi:cardiolipin synthase A/B
MFAAAKIPILVECLEKAAHRGVELTLVLESEEESEGQLSVDALQAFPKAIHDQASIYVWPYNKRALNARRRPGKLHAKCAVVDDAAIISSANLTDDAFNRNIELGILIRGSNISNAIYRQFSALIEAGVLSKRTT